MDPSNHESQVIELLQKRDALKALVRRLQAECDWAHLTLRFNSQGFNSSTVASIVKAVLIMDGESPEEVACVVCGGVPVTEWMALSIDPVKAGLHCAAHKEAFHSVCASTYNCCEQYDPDRDYEWRGPLEPQE